MFGIIEDGTYRVENIGYSAPVLTIGYVVATRPIKREADLPTTGELFGRWTAADGTVYWDAVEVIDDLHTALTLAAQRGEQAVWDIAAGVEIPTSAAAILDADEAHEYEVRVMTIDGIEEAYHWTHDLDEAWADYAAAAAWGMGYYRTLSDEQGTVLAEGVTA